MRLCCKKCYCTTFYRCKFCELHYTMFISLCGDVPIYQGAIEKLYRRIDSKRRKPLSIEGQGRLERPG